MSDSILILKTKPVVRVEIARSFSYKLNCANHGGAAFESRDFFASEKAECSIEDAQEVSAALYQFCRAEVMRSVKEYIREMAEQKKERVAA
jgi:hypothetical protein